MTEEYPCVICGKPAMYKVKNGKGEYELLCGNCTAKNEIIEKYKKPKENVVK